MTTDVLDVSSIVITVWQSVSALKGQCLHFSMCTYMYVVLLTTVAALTMHMTGLTYSHFPRLGPIAPFLCSLMLHLIV